MIYLTLKNIRRARHLRWDEYRLQATNVDNQEHVATIFETDQIQFVLNCPVDTVSAKIVIGGAELVGSSLLAPAEDGTTFTFTPKKHSRFGYDAFFLHYCGIAQIGAVITSVGGGKQRVLFQSINVCGRKVTSERVLDILKYLSNNITKDLLEALSPTQFRASLVNDGISAADRLQLLENTLNEIEKAVRNIAHRPLTSMRPTAHTIQDPTPEKMASSDLEWVVENSGQSVEADSADVALFHYGLKWRTIHEIQSVRSADSTDIEENLIVWYHLNTLRRAASEILRECTAPNSEQAHKHYEQDGEVYTNFYSIAKHMLSIMGESYHHRAQACLNRVTSLIRIFESAVPTSKARPSTLRPTIKMQANRNYMQLVRSMHSWLEMREIVWIEKLLFSSINSTWKLFEYYLVVNTHKQLCEQGVEFSGSGLFSGVINDVPVRLLYEPTIRSVRSSSPADQYVVVDRNTSGHRKPDIVIEVGDRDELKLLIFDAKCRSEKDVWDDLQKCELKYTGAIRSKKTGEQIVTALIMLYPMTTDHRHSEFQDYYIGPYGLNEPLSASPAMGLQRTPINSEGNMTGYRRLLSSLIEKHAGHPSMEDSSILQLNTVIPQTGTI